MTDKLQRHRQLESSPGHCYTSIYRLILHEAAVETEHLPQTRTR